MRPYGGDDDALFAAIELVVCTCQKPSPKAAPPSSYAMVRAHRNCERQQDALRKLHAARMAALKSYNNH
jgi:hypothetical protein